MTSLPDLFDDAVADAPPSRLSADDVYTAMRRRRRNTGALTALLVGVMSVTVAGGIATAIGGGAPSTSGSAPATGFVQLSKGDASHLYGLRHECPGLPSGMPSPSVAVEMPAPNRPCYTLVASVDAGATWAERDAQWTPVLEVLGPTMLVRPAGKSLVSPEPGEPERAVAYELSTDAGVTWRALTFDTNPVEAIPPGGALYRPGLGYAGPRVVDPMELTIRPLANPPALDEGFWQLSRSGSALWITGIDPATRIPAVAASHDRGRTWTVTTLPDAPAGSAPHAIVHRVPPTFTVVSTGDVVAYAVMWGNFVTDGGQPGAVPQIYRTGDGGLTWQALYASTNWVDPGRVWATTSGDLVLCRPDRCLLSSEGKPFAEANPPGLPLGASGEGLVRATADAIYVSEDGWTWRRI